MTRGWTTLLYVVSVGAHALLAAGVAAIHEPAPPPPPVHIVVREVHRARPADLPPAPEPPPPVPPPVAPPAPTPARPPTPRAEAPAPAAPPPAPAPAPAFGLALSGAVGAGGVAVPVGDPGGVPGGTGTRTTRTAERRTLEAPAAAPSADEDACAEAAVRPRALEMPRPTYTEEARAAGIEGRVRVEVHIGTDGAVEDVRVVTSLDPGLDEAALAAVRGAHFTPQTRCGAAEATTFTIGVSFAL